MQLKDFLGKTVIFSKTGTRFLIHRITAPEICVVTVALGPHGFPSYYAYETINGDPFSRGTLVFEDPSLLEPFQAAYDAYCQTEDARWGIYGYYLRKE